MLELFISIILVFFVGFEVSGPSDRGAADRIEEYAPPELALSDVPEAGIPEDPSAPVETEPYVDSAPASFGDFTSAAEVRPILDMTRDHWVALSADGGQDMLYFTHLLAWRCGLSEIRYGLNGAPATEVLPTEPCHIGTTSPNAITDMSYPLFLILPPGSLQSIEVELVYDDGTTAAMSFARERILMP